MNSDLVAQGEKCRLSVRGHLKESSTLSISYEFHNQGSRNIYIFNRLFRRINQDKVFETDVNLVNVEVMPAQVLVSKKIVPVPADIDVEKPIIPCATLVRPGESFSESFAVELPLRPWTPYSRGGKAERGKIPDARQVWVEVGYFSPPRDGDALRRQVQTLEGPAFRFDPFPYPGQQVLQVGPLPFPVAVLSR